MKLRKTPMRMCIACRQMKPKKELMRIVLPKEGGMDLDLTGKAHGRGAYVCRDVQCVETVKKSKKLRISSETIRQLEEELAGFDG